MNRPAIVLAGFAVVFIALVVGTYTQKSATVDEPLHLSKGYVALRLGDFHVHPENPPLLRMWAALPLLAMRDVRLDTNTVFWTSDDQWSFGHEFLYRQNDADRLLYSARFMIALLGVLLGALLFCWARELYGVGAATGVLAFAVIEPNLLAHAGLVTTDLGATCFIFGAMYFLWRTARACTTGNLAGLTVFFALAQASKFTALLLWPVAIIVLIWRRKPAILLLLLAGWLVAVWASYGFRYAPTAGASGLYEFSRDPGVMARVPRLAAVVDWVDRHRLLPNAYSQGLLIEQARGQHWLAYLRGHISRDGWWYYFPVAFAVKTPVALLVLLAGGIALSVKRREFFLPVIFVAGMSVAMTTRLNVGLRHILPLVPFALLLAGRAIQEILVSRRRLFVGALAALWLFAAEELALAYPHTLAFFNQAIGGPRAGHEWLLDSNLDWGQDLKGLGRWMRENNVEHVNLSYFGSADPAYYGIRCTYLDGSPSFAADAIAAPRLPGFVAISAQNLHGVLFDEAGRAHYRPLLAMEPVAVIGHSIYVYWVEKPWW